MSLEHWLWNVLLGLIITYSTEVDTVKFLLDILNLSSERNPDKFDWM